jgi:hypothetical protein
MYNIIFGQFSQQDRDTILESFDHMVQAMSEHCRETGKC